MGKTIHLHHDLHSVLGLPVSSGTYWVAV